MGTVGDADGEGDNGADQQASADPDPGGESQATSLPAQNTDVDVTATPIPSISGNHGSMTFTKASSDCSYPAGQDDAGNKVTYHPANAVDGWVETAWRCPGAGGHTIVLDSDYEYLVHELAVVPGYAKTDPTSGVDRFWENHVATQVLWRLWDGSTWHRVVQHIDNPTSDYATVELSEPVFATHIELTVIETAGGSPRVDSTPISEVAAYGDLYMDYH